MPTIVIMVENHKIKKERCLIHSYYHKPSTSRVDVGVEDEGSPSDIVPDQKQRSLQKCKVVVEEKSIK